MASDTREGVISLDKRTPNTTEMTTESIQRERSFRFHDALRRTGSLLGEEDCSKEWISETRSNFTRCASAVLPRQRPNLLVTQLDRGRRNNPQPTLTNHFRARHGQHRVCAVETLLPETKEAEVTQRSAYRIEFQERPLPPTVRWRSAPVVPKGILPSYRVPVYDDVRQEILLPVEISEKSPSTENPNKYMARRRRVSEHLNQHRARDTPYGSSSPRSAPPGGRYHNHFITTQGRPLATRRHVSAPPPSLIVRGFDGGAQKITDNTMHGQLLPFLRGPKII